MIRFSIFGIPVEVQPFFWITSALMGGAISADSRDAFLAVILFILAAFVSILIHELGHALTGRRLGGGYASIALTAFGGLAYNEGGRFTRTQRFWMIAAGPGYGFAFLLAILAVMGAVFHSQDVIAFAARSLFEVKLPFRTYELIDFFNSRPFIYLFLDDLLWINFWWGVMNLAPVLPLDGGQITNLYVTPQRQVFVIGLVAAGAISLYGFATKDNYLGILFGFLAWQNYQNMQQGGWR